MKVSVVAPHRAWGAGPGRTRTGPNGRQRIRRRTVSHEPAPAPWTAIASWPYSEHDGKKRHGDRRPANARWYHSIAATSAHAIGCDVRHRGRHHGHDRIRRRDLRQQPGQFVTQLIERQFDRLWPSRRPAGDPGAAAWSGPPRRQDRSQPAPEAIAGHRRAERAADRERDTTSRSSRGRDTRCTTGLIGGSACPHCARRSNAWRSRIRSIKPRDGRGPWRGGS